MGVLGDVRYALRSLARTPGFVAVALLTIALGIGANTAVFSVVDAVLLRPLPYADSDRLIAIQETDRRSPNQWHEVSYPNFLDWQRGTVAIGIVAGLALTGVLSGLIYGLSRTDPATFASVAGLVAVVAVVACLIPARAATRLDPVAALRTE